MDGRTQRNVADYLIATFGVRYLDTITTAGAIKHLAEVTDQTKVLLKDLSLSIGKHSSKRVAVVAHHDCIGNQVSDASQKKQLVMAMERLADLHPEAELMALWVNEQWAVERVPATG